MQRIPIRENQSGEGDRKDWTTINSRKIGQLDLSRADWTKQDRADDRVN